MNVDIFRHWIPDLKQSKNKNAYTATQCPFCPKVPKSKSFRINLKLKVWKCFQCGRGGKNENKLIHYRKRQDKWYNYNYQQKILKRIGHQPRFSPLLGKGFSIEVHYGCETLKETLLPF